MLIAVALLACHAPGALPVLLLTLCCVCLSHLQRDGAVLYAVRCSWYASEDKDKVLESGLINTDTAVERAFNFGRLSVLWRESNERMTESLVCSSLACGKRAYWTCSDAGCHLASLYRQLGAERIIVN